jgi:hypothetical protein
MRRAAVLACLAALGLAGCASPYQRCVAPALDEIRTVDRLIAETEANIARGYRLQPEQRWRPTFTFCTGSRNDFDVCWVDQPYTVTRPVAIDRSVERGTLASLQERRGELLVAARRQQAACAAAHPQG